MKQLIIFFVAIFTLCSCIKDKQTGVDLAVGDRIPDFSVIMNDGSKISGNQLRQGKACIVFFTTACPDCKVTLPHIQKLYDDYSSKGVRFAVISREDGQKTVAGYWIEQQFTMPYSAQEDRAVYELFAKTRVPRVYICSDGVIKAIFTDQPENPSYDTLKAAIEAL